MSMQRPNEINQAWFEMGDVRRRKFANAVWVPLHLNETLMEVGEHGRLGSVHEITCVGSVAIPVDRRAEAERLGWSDVGIGHNQCVWATLDYYKPAEIYEASDRHPLGTDLVLVQRFLEDQDQWHLNQDIVFALKLRREDDEWVRPEENYEVVARLRRDSVGSPTALEIKNEYLRDYLAARKMFLCISAYHERVLIDSDSSKIRWPNNQLEEEDAASKFRGRAYEILEGGDVPNASFAVFRVGRTDIVSDDEIPRPGPETADNVKVETRQGVTSGPILWRISGEYWHDETVEPGTLSPRVRGDEEVSGIKYVVDAAGTKVASEDLSNEDDPRWLWFRPQVIPVLANRRGGRMNWYTEYTGGVTPSPGPSVHYGVNPAGKVTVFAPDVAALPTWQQRIWSAYNISPEGGVSDELLSAQMRSVVAKTHSPEGTLPIILEKLDRLFRERLGGDLFVPHAHTPDLLKVVHRFRALEPQGIYSLAKDLIRLTTERIDKKLLQKIAPPPKDVTWGTIRSLEGFLATLVTVDEARTLLTPIVGVYELRKSDSHLPAGELNEAFAMARVKRTDHLVEQGTSLIASTVECLNVIGLVVYKKRSSLP